MLKNICAIDQYQCLILALRRVLTIASKICLDNCFAAYYNVPYMHVGDSTHVFAYLKHHLTLINQGVNIFVKQKANVHIQQVTKTTVRLQIR